MKRTFIAIKISISPQFDKIINRIKLSLNHEKIRWVENKNIHITLFFLGDTHENVIEKISVDLQNIGVLKSFLLTCKGIGVFKNYHDPKVIWAGLERSDELIGLKKEIDELMFSFGFETDEKPFKPHVTLGRLKYIKDKNNLKLLLDEFKDTYFQSFNIDEIIFYESQLTPHGPIYRVISKVKLS